MGLYQVIIDKHEQGIEANCGNYFSDKSIIIV